MSTISEPKAQRPRPAARKPLLPPPPAPPIRRGWHRFAPAAGVALLLGSLLGARYLLQAGGDAALGQGPAPAAGSVICHGYFDTEQPVAALAPALPGKVVRVLAVEGREYAKGDELLRVDDGAALDAVALAVIGVRVAEAQLMQARQAAALHPYQIKEQEAAVFAANKRIEAADAEAKSVERQVGTLVNSDQFAAKQKFADAVRAGLKGETAKLETLKAAKPDHKVEEAAQNVELANRRVAQAERAVEDFVVRAPEDGRVLRIGVAAGNVLGAQTRATPILFVPKAAKSVVRVEVEQEVAHHVHLNDPVTVTDKYNHSASWTGKVSAIAEAYLPRRSAAEAMVPQTDVKVLECLIVLDEAKVPPKLGQPLRAEVRPAAK